MANRVRDAGLLLLASLAVGLGAAHVDHLLITDDPALQLLEAGIPLLLCLGILAGVWWIYDASFSRAEVGRVVAWSVVGVVGMLITMTWTIGHLLFGPDGVDHLEYVIANNVTGGLVVGMVLGAYDVARRRRQTAYTAARDRLQRERDRFATLFENVPSPTVYHEFEDGEPIVLSANPAFSAVFGIDEADAVGKSVDDLIVPEDSRDEAERLNRQLEDRDGHVEVTRLAADGSREFLLYTVVLSSKPERGFATYVDITDQKRREQRLQVLNRVLRHDLRNAMNVVVGHADTLESGAESPAVAAAAIRRRSEQLLDRSRKARIVERVLDVDTRTVHRVDVADLVADRCTVAHEAYPELNVSLDRPDEPVWITASSLLDVAVDNLLENVAAHVDDPRVRVTVRHGDPVTVSVRDWGPGIPDAELDVLDRDRETQLEHTSGLGLWLVSWVVRDAGGDVSFRTLPDGTEVTLTLPRAQPPESPEDGGSSVPRSVQN